MIKSHATGSMVNDVVRPENSISEMTNDGGRLVEGRRLFDRKAWKKIRIEVPKKVVMSTLKVGYAFQSKISPLQTSDGMSALCAL